jgi:DNA polymerase III gamma/tau subunit
MISYETNHMNYIKDWLNQNIDIKQLDIIRLMEFLLKFELKIKFLNQPDLALEVLMIKLCNLDSLVNVSAIIEALDNDIKSNISKKENVKKNNIENEKLEDEISTPDISKKSINSNKDIEVEKQNITSVSIISKEGVKEKLDDIMNLIDEKNSKTAGFMNDVDVLDVNGSTITILINNISDFLYDTLLNDINLIKESFNIILDTDHNIIIKKGTELVKKEDKSKKNTKDEEHPLFMDALEKFDGQILR